MRYTRGDLPEDTRTDWDRIDAMTEEEIESNAINDAEWTQEDETAPSWWFQEIER